MPNIGTPTRRNTYPAQALPHKLRSTKTNFFPSKSGIFRLLNFFPLVWMLKKIVVKFYADNILLSHWDPICKYVHIPTYLDHTNSYYLD